MDLIMALHSNALVCVERLITKAFVHSVIIVLDVLDSFDGIKCEFVLVKF